MSAAVKGRDKRIRELERQVAELTERLNAMNGKSGVTTDG
jgi:t-SNARE complex subunit (syntaxin)